MTEPTFVDDTVISDELGSQPGYAPQDNDSADVHLETSGFLPPERLAVDGEFEEPTPAEVGRSVVAFNPDGHVVPHWTPVAELAPDLPIGGDLDGTVESSAVVKIQGRPVDDGAPADGDSFVWSGTAWVPAQVAPKAHTHPTSDVDGLDDALDGIDTALAGKAASAHTHAEEDVIGLTEALTDIADELGGIGTTLAGKSDVGHGHAQADVAGLVDTLDGIADDLTGIGTTLAGKSDVGHGHAQADVSGLTDALDGKAAAIHDHAASGDVAGASLGSLTVEAIQGRPVLDTAPSLNDGIVWNGTAWAPARVYNPGSVLVTVDGSVIGSGSNVIVVGVSA